MKITAFSLAQRFVGVREIAGKADNPMVLSMLTLDASWPQHDEVPWCSAFVNYIAWLLRLPRSKSLRARSWLEVGRPLDIMEEPLAAFDVVVLKRGGGDQPGPEVLEAQGHVGFYAGREDDHLLVLGGNQGDTVSIKPFPTRLLLGMRRLKE